MWPQVPIFEFKTYTHTHTHTCGPVHLVLFCFSKSGNAAPQVRTVQQLYLLLYGRTGRVDGSGLGGLRLIDAYFNQHVT
jgi:hypothetical protein